MRFLNSTGFAITFLRYSEMRLIIISLLLVLATGCSPEIQVYTDYDPDNDRWAYSTFTWNEVSTERETRDPLYYSSLNDKRIRKAVQKELLKRNYQFVTEKADLLFQYHILVEDKSVVATEPFGYIYGPYWMRKQQHVYTYTQGTLILDLIDTRINQLIWRGWAVSAIDGLDSPERIEKLINEAVQKVFTKFPRSRKDYKRGG